MKRSSFSLKYMLLTYRLDMLWLPVAFWALFLIIAIMIRSEPAGFPVTVAYLGTALPLVGGILAAYAVLDDPALELQFATPRPVWQMLAERIGMILVITTVCAFTYQGVLALVPVDLAPLGGFWPRQLAWVAPTLAAVSLGAAMAFANRHGTGGAAAIGMLWIMQIILRDWFLSSPWARYILLLMGSNYPDNPALRANQVTLVSLSVILLLASWALLRRQERYI